MLGQNRALIGFPCHRINKAVSPGRKGPPPGPLSSPRSPYWFSLPSNTPPIGVGAAPIAVGTDKRPGRRRARSRTRRGHAFNTTYQSTGPSRFQPHEIDLVRTLKAIGCFPPPTPAGRPGLLRREIAQWSAAFASVGRAGMVRAFEYNYGNFGRVLVTARAWGMPPR
jgi:hypothetical protein